MEVSAGGTLGTLGLEAVPAEAEKEVKAMGEITIESDHGAMGPVLTGAQQCPLAASTPTGPHLGLQ